ncbi:MAG TPA: hypothetical protein VMT89_10990, partial [Candidatus Acidoferrales bacterium]|nr:hypothetical protein [Candidatus Acidoferrales bacterium]
AGEAVPLVLPVELAINRLMATAKSGVTFGEVPYELRVTLSLAALMLERDVTLVQSSVLQINLPLGLVQRSQASMRVDAFQSRETGDRRHGGGGRQAITSTPCYRMSTNGLGTETSCNSI